MKDRLVYVMKKLNLTDKAVGDMMNVDKSLVNKWKNGKRPLSKELPYYNLLIEALSRLYDTKDISIREDFLRSLPDNAPAEDTLKLFDWFLNDRAVSVESIERADFKVGAVASLVFKDCVNNYKAYNAFFEQLASKSSGTLRIFFSGCGECAESKVFSAEYITELAETLARGITIDFLIETYEDDMSIEMLMRFLDVSFKDNFRLFLKKSKTCPLYIQNFMIFDKSFAIETNSLKNARNYYSEVLFDEVRCDFLLNKFKAEWGDGSPLLIRMPAKRFANAIFELRGAIESSSETYSYAGIPMFLFMSGALADEILAYNGLYKSDRVKILADCDIIRRTYYSSLKNQMRGIFCMENFDRMLTENESQVAMLSSVVGKPVYASKELMSKILSEWIVHFNEYENVQVMLSPKPLIRIGEDWGCYIKQYNFAIIWKESEKFSNNLFTDDAYNTQLIYNLIDDAWNTAGSFVKDKAAVTKYVRGIIAALEKSN